MTEVQRDRMSKFRDILFYLFVALAFLQIISVIIIWVEQNYGLRNISFDRPLLSLFFALIARPPTSLKLQRFALFAFLFGATLSLYSSTKTVPGLLFSGRLSSIKYIPLSVSMTASYVVCIFWVSQLDPIVSTITKQKYIKYAALVIGGVLVMHAITLFLAILVGIGFAKAG